MSVSRLKARVRFAKVFKVACLYEHVLKFHKKSKDGSGKCDAVKTDISDDVVWGVVFEIDKEKIKILNRYEGKGSGYEIKEVLLIGDDDKEIKAFTYYATEKDPSKKPYHWYKEHVLRGAQQNGLPSDYIQKIKLIESIEDPDSERCKREMEIDKK